MLMGAYTGFLAAFLTGSVWLGFAGGACRGDGGGRADGPVLRPPGTQPDRDRHRPDAGRRRADGDPAHTSSSRGPTRGCPAGSRSWRSRVSRNPGGRSGDLCPPPAGPFSPSRWVVGGPGLTGNQQSGPGTPRPPGTSRPRWTPPAAVHATAGGAVLFTGGMAGYRRRIQGECWGGPVSSRSLPAVPASSWIVLAIAWRADGRSGCWFGALIFGASLATDDGAAVRRHRHPDRRDPIAAPPAVYDSCWCCFGGSGQPAAALGQPYVRGAR